MTRQMVIDKITREADKIAIQYNKTKDPGLRDQWFKLVRLAYERRALVSEEESNPLRSPSYK